MQYHVYIAIIAKDHNIKQEHLVQFLSEYLTSIFEQNRGVWLLRYKLDHGLAEENQYDIISWAKNKLALPGIIRNSENILDEWEYILETYLRAFSINLAKNEVYFYLKINKGARLDPDYWSGKLKIEKTFMDNKMDYIVYHTENAKDNTTSGAYLTPVKLEWIFNLNPIYYYYLLYNKKSILYNMRGNEDVDRAIQLINDNKNLFSTNTLIAYLDQLDNRNISEIVRQDILKLKN